MGIIGNFFGLILNGGYLASKVSSQKVSEREYDERVSSFRYSYNEMSTLLKDNKLESIVKSFVSKPTNEDKISKMLARDIEYITSGDDSVQILEQQKIDLLLSKFGKISSSTFSECTRFGNLTKVGKTLDSYNRSIRVMQCVESNIYSSTGRYVLFGVDAQEPCFDGKYCSAKITVIFGGGLVKTVRIYNGVKIPFESIKIEYLEND